MLLHKFIILLIGIAILQHTNVAAQATGNDTIRLGSVTEHGAVYAMILLPEYTRVAKVLDNEEVKRVAQLRNIIFSVYPYAATAAVIMKDVNAHLDNLPDRRAKKEYIKSIDKKLDQTFKEPLKNLSINQGHILVKLIDRQTGQNCFSIIREFKSGLAAVMWQSVGVFFNNNLNKRYDPDGEDKEIESIVRDIETSNLYNYELYQQQLLLSKVQK